MQWHRNGRGYAGGMAAKLIDGKAAAAAVKDDVARRVADLFRESGRPTRLVAVLIGPTDGSSIYARRQAATCAEVGIDYELLKLPSDTTQEAVEAELARLGADGGVTGLMLHLPVPPHLDRYRLQTALPPAKDVEGVHPQNIGHCLCGQTYVAPCTAAASFELVRVAGVEVAGAEACVVGASEIAGKPAAMLLTQAEATVTICHKKTRDLAAHTRQADILVVAAGYPNLIGPDHVKPGACVIDVGINRVTTFSGKKRTVGDVDFDRVEPVAGHLTPVPGGVGPVTVAMLLRNTIQAAEMLS